MVEYCKTVEFVKDLILTCVAIIGAVVAIMGLSTWQRQLKGRTEYDLSRRLLVSLFKYRDAINFVRYPVMWENEMPSPSEEAEKISDDQRRFYGTSKAYQKRWDKVQNERTNLYADLLEAEALWGDELKELFKVIYDLETELGSYIRYYLVIISPETHEAKKDSIQRLLTKKRDVMYDDLSQEEDDFKKEFRGGVEKIEKYLKPKLSR